MSEAVGAPQRRLPLAEISRVVPGLYGWVATVLAPALQTGVSLGARAMAGLALAALLGSYALSTRPQLARRLGVHGFVLGSFGCWFLLGAHLGSDQLDPVRSALGALGFLLHALAWGAPDPRPVDSSADNLVPGSPLQPRSRSPRAGTAILGVGVALALLPALVAFRVERPAASLLAHALALGCGLLLIAASTDVALRVGKARELPAWRERASRALWPLGGLTLALAIGLLWLALR